MDGNLQVPDFLPNGQTLYVDHDFYDRLHNGDATIGWLGDERLGVYHNDGRLEIWRHCEDGEVRLVMRSRPSMNVLDTKALRFLAEHDSRQRGGFDAAADAIAHNQKILDERDAAAHEKAEEAADRLHFALTRDIGAYETGQTKRLYTGIDLPNAR